MKPDKPFLAAACVVVAAVCLIALTWVGTMRAIDAQREQTTDRVTATLTNQALTFTEQIDRQILALDQTLRGMVAAWEADPAGFNLDVARTRATVLQGLSRDMVLTDENGIIRQSSVNEAINQNASRLDYFRILAAQADLADQTVDHPANPLYIGPATIDAIMRQWHMNIARMLHHPDGSFAGVIDADYRIAAITDVFSQTDLGPGSLMALVGIDDGKLRGAVGPAGVEPDAAVGDTPMFAAIRAAHQGVWTGPSASDAVRRIHAFRRLPDRSLAVIVAMNEDEAMRPATEYRRQAELAAGLVTALLTGLALALIQCTRIARRRRALVVESAAALAASNAQFEVARAYSVAKTEQLEATLAGMSDGVSLIDAHMCLVEWNARFPEVAGVPPDLLRVGLAMEEILRAQIRTGQFGAIADPEAEVARRMARLRVAPFGVSQRQRPDGHTIELRRNRLPDGGFVTLYADITEHKMAEEALRKAREAADIANNEKSRFVAIVSHEIRTPLNALLNTIRLLSDSVLAPAQRSLLTMAHQSGDALFGLINDILDLSRMEAGKLPIRPSLFELRPLLDSSAEMFAAQAAERGLSIHVSIAEGTPGTLLTDPGRLRQVQLNLLSNAVKYARPGEIRVIAEPGRSPNQALRLTVRDDGPVIAADLRERLFRPFSRLDQPGADTAQGSMQGTGLGLAICHQLMRLMGGEIGCEAWSAPENTPGAREGNAFWLTLPATALPFRTPLERMDAGTLPSGPDEPAARPPETGSLATLPRRPPPRTRILLTEDIVANQVVTATLLRRAGHHVDIADSGPAAVKAVQTAPYDLVFMDIFMPGMSGHEATRIIRALPEPARSVPIVALTANMGTDDDARFKAAGMDGILGKPVVLTELLDAVDRHVWSSRHATVRTAPPSEVATDRSANAAPGVLANDRIEELRANLPPETFATLIEECLIDMDHRLPALRRAMATGVPGAIAAHAHALVGMAAGYGMMAVESRLRAIMAAARDGGAMPPDTTAMAALEADFAEASSSLRELLRREEV